MFTVNRQQPEPEESALKAVAEAARRLFAVESAVVAPVNPVTGDFYGRPGAAGGDHES